MTDDAQASGVNVVPRAKPREGVRGFAHLFVLEQAKLDTIAPSAPFARSARAI
jgi:hypothetical protein